MTRTLLTVVLFIGLSFLAASSIVRAEGDAAAPAADQPAASTEKTAAPTATQPAAGDRVTERMRQRREAMRNLEANPGERPDAPLGPGPDGPGRGRMQGPPDENQPPKPLTEAQRQQVLAVLREVNPDFADKINEALKTNPERANHAIQRFAPRLLELAELKKTDPDLYKLKVTDQRYNVETLKLLRQLNEARTAADDAKVERITGRLRELLNKHFDVRMKLREHELAMLEKRIQDVRDELKDHHERKQQIIDEQVDRMTSDAPPPPPPEDEKKAE